MNVLVVGEELRAADIFRRAFEHDGHACFTASSLDEATRVLAREPVDGIVLDLGVPWSEGVAWLDEVASEHPALTRRAVVATASDLASDERRHIAMLGAVLLMKPFSFETLRSVLLERVGRERTDNVRNFFKLRRRR